jgi:SAM-dependent methyltransferase
MDVRLKPRCVCRATTQVKIKEKWNYGPIPIRDSRELLSAVVSYRPPPGRVLDLGCGPKDQAKPFRHLGYEYLGVDVDGSNADTIADAHNLPFDDLSFDVVFSYAVLEHLHSPFVAIREVERVLKPGGVYVGTVSQGEPFHASYFHHTAWGLLSLVQSTETMTPLRLWAGQSTLGALGSMGKYPRVIRALISAVDFADRKMPWLAPRRQMLDARARLMEEIYRAGSICFVVAKSKPR